MELPLRDLLEIFARINWKFESEGMLLAASIDDSLKLVTVEGDLGPSERLFHFPFWLQFHDGTVTIWAWIDNRYLRGV